MKLNAASFRKIRFVVIDDNMLGYLIPGYPLSAQILAASIVRGAVSSPGASYPLPLDPIWVRSDACPKPLDLAKFRKGEGEVVLDSRFVRPARRSDFDALRVQIEGFAKDTDHYEFTPEQLAG